MDDATRARWLAWIDTLAPPDPGPGGPLAPPAGPPGTAADLPMPPGPQPWNGGLTPGWEGPRAESDPATVGDVLEARADAGDALDGLGRLAGEVRRLRAELKAELWELALAVARLTGRVGGAEGRADATPDDSRSR